MIVEMSHVRMMGPKAQLRQALAELQDLGVLHLIEPAAPPGVSRHPPCPAERRRRRHLQRALADVEAVLAGLLGLGAVAPAEAAGTAAAAARIAGRLRPRVNRLRARRQALVDEQDALRTYEPLLVEFESVLRATSRRYSAYLLQLRGGDRERSLEMLQDGLGALVGGEHQLIARPLGEGQTALLLLVPTTRAADIDKFLASARVEPAPVPAALGGLALGQALPRMRERLAEIGRDLAAIAAEAAELMRAHGGMLLGARRGLHDELIELDAHGKAAETSRAFLLEGWVPARERLRLTARLQRSLGGAISVAEVTRAEWHAEQAPVVLSNPTVFEPFERVTAMLPLPRYGTIDPTPYVAVFFPMLFGIVVGDIGHGLLMGAIAALIAWRSPPRGVGRDIAKIGGAMAAFTVAFGFLYGEFLGDLGRSWLGLHPIWMDREEAILPFLTFAIALGVAHLLLGLVVGVVASVRGQHTREAFGRGVTLFMLATIAIALLATFEQLPSALFTPAIVALLVAFPLLIVLEGVAGLIELMSIIGHVLSYARIMALGVASVMLAVVANKMVGAFGSVAIGVVFALLFHLVNFAIGLFSPTIQVLRLHYVEFFGTFFSPGGTQYQPLAHWTPEPVGPS